MPELPEVQTTVDGLKSKVLKRTFVGVWSDWKKTIKKPNPPAGGFAQFEKDIKNKKIKKIWRRAKNVIFDLSDGSSLLIHQKMTGHLLVGNWIRQLVDGKEIWKPTKAGPLNDPYNRFLHLIFFLDNGEMMALSDARKFAKVELWKPNELLNSKEFKNIGPEPLDKNFTLGKFKEVFIRRGLKGNPQGKKISGRIKQVLMNPEIIAGIGNIYSSEILWWSKVHPEKSIVNLSEKELKLLYKYTKKVLEASVRLGGESFSDYRKVDGSKGSFDTEKMAYKREGQKCNRCGSKIKRIKFGGRSAFFCPNCQKLN